jgi:hypothetical protein
MFYFRFYFGSFVIISILIYSTFYGDFIYCLGDEDLIFTKKDYTFSTSDLSRSSCIFNSHFRPDGILFSVSPTDGHVQTSNHYQPYNDFTLYGSDSNNSFNTSNISTNSNSNYCRGSTSTFTTRDITGEVNYTSSYSVVPNNTQYPLVVIPHTDIAPICYEQMDNYNTDTSQPNRYSIARPQIDSHTVNGTNRKELAKNGYTQRMLGYSSKEVVSSSPISSKGSVSSFSKIKDKLKKAFDPSDKDIIREINKSKNVARNMASSRRHSDIFEYQERIKRNKNMYSTK